jgi:PKD repeat protein
MSFGSHLTSVRSWLSRRQPAGRRLARARLQLEALERRDLMDIGIGTLPNYTGLVGSPVNFQGGAYVTTTGVATGLTYDWDFGDGTPHSSAADVGHTYRTAGTYTATLVVSDAEGDFNVAQTDVLVRARQGYSSFIVTRYDIIPNFGAHPTIVSAHGGNWSDPSTWVSNRIPTTGDIVEITAGSTVIYDRSDSSVLNTISLDAGSHLQFRTDINTLVVVANLVVKPGAWLEVGSAANPVAANVTATVMFPDQALNPNDYEQYGNGLIGLGKVTMCGQAKTGFQTLSAELHAGTTVLHFAAPVSGWAPGDKLFIPDTHQLDWWEQFPSADAYVRQDETATVASVSADGLTVTLTTPLAFDHLGSQDGGAAPEFLPQVADLTRNVIVRSANPYGHRGYMLFEDRADVDIRYTADLGLGRTTNDDFDDTTFGDNGRVNHVGTNEEGRYPVSFRHLIGPATTPADGYQYTFLGNVVRCPLNPMPFRWAIDLFDSHYGWIANNVMENWAGAGLMAEGGNETGNLIQHNFAAVINGTGLRDGMGNEGAGFWFRGPNNLVEDNVATDIRGGYNPYAYGFVINALYLGPLFIPKFKGADPTLDGQGVFTDMNSIPLAEFSGNEVYGATYNGISAWWLGTWFTTPDGTAGVIRNMVVWNVSGFGYYGYESNNLTIDGFTFRGDTRLSPENWSVYGIWFSDYFQKGLVITNADIRGAQVGIVTPLYSDGLTVIQNSYLKNQIDIQVGTMGSVNGSEDLPAKFTQISNVRFAAPVGTAAGSPYLTIDMNFSTEAGESGAPTNLCQLDQVMVYNYNGVAGDNFQLYYVEQAADYVVPASNDDGLVGAPVDGMTNQQLWDLYGMAVAGAVAPSDATTRDGIQGLVRAL